MKILTLLILQFFFLSQIAFTQKQFQITPYINYAVPVNKIALEEHGLGYFDFKYREEPMLEYGLQIGKILKNPKWDIGVTFSYKEFKSSYTYATYKPWTESPNSIKSANNETIEYNWFGLGLYSAYQINRKWRAALIFEINSPIMGSKHTGNSYDFSTGESLFSNGETISQNGISHQERLSPSYDPYDYAIPELRLNYQISKVLELSGGIKYKPYKNKNNNYRLHVIGNGDFIEPLGTGELNDTRITNKFLLLYAGLNYRFEFLERKTKTKMNQRKQ